MNGSYNCLRTYVSRSHELSNGYSAAGNALTGNTGFGVQSNAGSDGSDDDSQSVPLNSGIDEEDTNIPMNPLIGLPPLLAARGILDPFQIQKKWDIPSKLPFSAVPQLDTFRGYVQDCRNIGVQKANERLMQLSASLAESTNAFCDENPTGSVLDPVEVLEVKKQLLCSCRNNDQKSWLNSVTSYLQVYYGCYSRTVPADVKKNL